MKMVFEKALEDPNISEEKKQQVRNLLESGQLDKEVTTEDRKIAKMLDDYVIREMKKSVKAGRLPNKKQLKGHLVNCNTCDKEIWKNETDLKRSKTGTYFCNPECRHKWVDKIMPKEEAHCV
jgi:YHS domain-containing protein